MYGSWLSEITGIHIPIEKPLETVIGSIPVVGGLINAGEEIVSDILPGSIKGGDDQMVPTGTNLTPAQQAALAAQRKTSSLFDPTMLMMGAAAVAAVLLLKKKK